MDVCRYLFKNMHVSLTQQFTQSFYTHLIYNIITFVYAVVLLGLGDMFKLVSLTTSDCRYIRSGVRAACTGGAHAIFS